MDKPTLVIMAAGMGSRFGGLKQIEPVSGEDEIILDLYTLIYMSTFFFIVGGCVFHLFIDRR